MSEFVTTSNGDRVSFDRHGAGHPLVFVAGAGPFRAIDPVTSRTAILAAELGVTTIVYDRLGRGESQVQGRIDLDRELAAIEALIDTAGEAVVLCGHSSGCSIALAAAAAGLPIVGLALWEPPIGSMAGGARAWADEVDRRIEAGDLDGAQRYYMKDMPPEFLEGVQGSPMWAALVAQVGSNRPDGESLAWAESAPLAELLGDVRVPIEVLVGEQTFDSMITSADLIVAALPWAERKRMPGANHSWEAEPMAAELARFVSEACTNAENPEDQDLQGDSRGGAGGI